MKMFFSLREDDPEEVAIIEWINSLADSKSKYRSRSVTISIVAALKYHIKTIRKKEIKASEDKDISSISEEIKKTNNNKKISVTTKTKEDQPGATTQAIIQKETPPPISNRLSSIMKNVKFD